MTHNQASLRHVLIHVKEIAVRIDAAIMHLDIHEIEALEVTNQQDLITGLSHLESFTDALHEAVRAWLKKHSRFEAKPPKKNNGE